MIVDGSSLEGALDGQRLAVLTRFGHPRPSGLNAEAIDLRVYLVQRQPKELFPCVDLFTWFRTNRW